MMTKKCHDRANQIIANFYKVCPLRHPFQLLFAYMICQIKLE